MAWFQRCQRWLSIHKSTNVIQHISWLQDKKHMIMSLDIIQHPFMTKVMGSVRMEVVYINMMKATYKVIANIMLNEEKSPEFPIKIRSKTMVSIPSTSFQYSAQSLSKNSKTKDTSRKRRSQTILIFQKWFYTWKTPKDKFKK